jgi:hypothetical protein
VKVNAYWLTNGEETIDIMSSQTLAVNCTQESSVESTAHISVTGHVGINPPVDSVTLAPGQTETIYFSISNPGLHEQMNDVSVTVISTNTFTGEQSSNSTVTCNLLQTITPCDSALNIHARDATNKPVVGLELFVCYPSSTAKTNATKYTDSDGVVKVDVATPNGWSYTGQLTIQTVETAEYKASILTTSVTSGQNDITINVIPKGTQTTQASLTTGVDMQLIIEVIALVGFLFFLSVIVIVYVKRKAKSAT